MMLAPALRDVRTGYCRFSRRNHTLPRRAEIMDPRATNARVVGRLIGFSLQGQMVEVGGVLGGLATHQQARHGVLQKRQPFLSLLDLYCRL